MKTIIHAGMHKTGSSSIQMTLAGNAPTGVFYPDTPTGNHSGLASLLFESAANQKHLLRVRGSTPADLERRKTRITAQIVAGLSAQEYETCVFSAERIMAFDLDATERMHAFFAQYSDDIQVIAYIRPPVGFMTSAFQQRLKSGQNSLKMQWPTYRASIEKLDQVFGRDRVTLKKFDPKQLKNNDVVVDFFDLVGMPLASEDIITTNESLSLEAVGLLFAQRSLGDGFVQGFRGAATMNQVFIEALRGIGSGKLALAPELLNPLIEENRDDLDWMEKRLGEPLLDAPKTEGRQIASEEDLLTIAEENRDALNARLLELIQAQDLAPRDQLVRNLNLLRTLCYASSDKSRS